MKKVFLLALVMMLTVLYPVSISASGIELPDLIGDHMLIQQAKPIKLWGTAPAGEAVTIRLMSGYSCLSKGTAAADSKGSFNAELPAVMAGGPYTLEFSTPSASKTVNDVLVGELWINGGQSNMAGTVNATGTHKEEFLPDKTMNEIRLFMNASKIQSSTRAADLEGQWQVATRAAVGTYSALGYGALGNDL